MVLYVYTRGEMEMAKLKTKEKVVLSVYIDREIVKAAKAAGLNLSKTAENALKQATEAIHNAGLANSDSFRQRFLSKKGLWCGGGDLNPGTPTGPAPQAGT
jgi:post-segregation antitoxin (ccd killing protein)